MSEENNMQNMKFIQPTPEEKIKSLEARLGGPSKDGNPPINITLETLDAETVKSSKNFFLYILSLFVYLLRIIKK
jgi:hypothetical protein